MSLVTVSKKRNRVYYREFDHDEARRLRAEDPKRWSYRALAEHFDVSYTAVQRLFNAHAEERLNRHTLRWARRRRRPCLGGCGTLVWAHTKNRTGYCLRCIGAQFAAANVREAELRCTRCGEWKPDDQFYRRRSNHARRGRATHCKPCSAIDRREHRHRNIEQERRYEHDYYRNVRREKKIMATFIVLQPREGGYDTIGEVEASSADHAIEKIAREPGVYVATSKARFVEVPVAPETSLRVRRETS